MRILLYGFLFLNPLFAQQAQLDVFHAAKGTVDVHGAAVAPRTLVKVKVRNASGSHAPSSWFDATRKFTLTLEQRWYDPQSIPVEILEIERSIEMIAVIPERAPVGSSTLVLRADDGLVATAPVRIVPVEPGIFTTGGIGPAVAQNTRNGRVQANALTRPAQPGDYVTIWATGLGSATYNDVEAKLGGYNLELRFAGPAPGLRGVDQINLRIPAYAVIPEGCYVPLNVSVRGVAANMVTLSTSRSDSPCIHPFGLSARQLADVDQGGIVPIGLVSIESEIGQPSSQGRTGLARIDSATALFVKMNAGTLATMSLVERSAPQSQPCAVDGPSISSFIVGGGEVISVGDRLRLANGGTSVELLPASAGASSSYSFPSVRDAFPGATPTTPPDVLAQSFWIPGRWTIEGAGRRPVGSFSYAIDVPPSADVLNYGQVRTVDRTRDLVVEWSGKNQAPDATMKITLQGEQMMSVSPFFERVEVRSVTCSAPASEGQVRIPAALLKSFNTRVMSAPPALVLQLSTPGKIFEIPYEGTDPIRSMVRYRSSQFLPLLIQ